MPVNGMPTYADTLSRQDERQASFMEQLMKLRALQNQSGIAQMQNAGETQRTGMNNANNINVAGMNNANRMAMQGMGIRGDMALQGQRLGAQQQSEAEQRQFEMERLRTQAAIEEKMKDKDFRQQIQMLGERFGLDEKAAVSAFGRAVELAQMGQTNELAKLKAQHGYGQEDAQLQGLIGAERARAAQQNSLQTLGAQHGYGQENIRLQAQLGQQAAAGGYEQQLKMLDRQQGYGQDNAMLQSQLGMNEKQFGVDLENKQFDDRFHQETKSKVLADLKNWNGMKEKLSQSTISELDDINADIRDLEKMGDGKAKRIGWDEIRARVAALQPDWKPPENKTDDYGNIWRDVNGKQEVVGMTPEGRQSLVQRDDEGTVIWNRDGSNHTYIPSPRMDPYKKQQADANELETISKMLTYSDPATGTERRPSMDEILQAQYRLRQGRQQMEGGGPPSAQSNPDLEIQQQIQQAEQQRGVPFSPQEKELMRLNMYRAKASASGDMELEAKIRQQMAPLMPQSGGQGGQSPLRGQQGGMPQGMGGMPAGLDAPPPGGQQQQGGQQVTIPQAVVEKLHQQALPSPPPGQEVDGGIYPADFGNGQVFLARYDAASGLLIPLVPFNGAAGGTAPAPARQQMPFRPSGLHDDRVHRGNF